MDFNKYFKTVVLLFNLVNMVRFWIIRTKLLCIKK